MKVIGGEFYPTYAPSIAKCAATHNTSRTQRQIAISPTVPQPARTVAEKLGIEVFGYAEDTTGL